ncbi:hypothetical protein [Mucilaginibacter sp. FT3.2]|uniref:hypothetical protein n=1 Tax=Mucilaginibacter sp. FT3.2 TaxID=2723090 RepID=UPI001606FFB7|nr:hypothetical protein [Mucilaginibacter sp. FT3.2]MBB6233970.1 hypothetical protein [Mucilaginibacter sp. FT3.2]
MKSAQGISLKYIVILTFALLGKFYLLFLSSFNIPENIPFTQIKINGLIISIIFLIALNFFTRELIRLRPDFTVGYLTLYGVAVCLITEVLFQGYMWHLFPEDTFYTFTMTIIRLSVVISLLSFFTAFQLKTRNTSKLIYFIVILIIVVNVLKYIFPTLLPEK